MQVVQTYTFAPGQCYTCSGTELPAIDTQRDTNLGAADARVYLCGTCVGAMWSMLSGSGGSPGLVPARNYQEQVVRADGAEARAADLEEALKALRGESPLAGAMQVLAETMARSFAAQPAQPEQGDGRVFPVSVSDEPAPPAAPGPDAAEPDATIDAGPPAAETATAPDGTSVPLLDPSSVPAGDAPAAEAEPFPAPDAASEVPDADAPPDPADEAPATGKKGSKAK